ncbi:hypothetical protein BMAPRL20_1061 [Burkholderia mallei PRL-20]|nr:hypothetical protein BMAPRL20_1061 [Burkholderia mallei PRL-20]
MNESDARWRRLRARMRNASMFRRRGASSARRVRPRASRRALARHAKV